MRIAIVGKYVDLTESYKSLAEALTHGGIANDCRVYLKYVDSEKIEQDGVAGMLDDVDGILVPGGFGERGTEGKIKAIEYARTSKIPFFGICLGMQMAVVEFARNVCGLEDAFSSEFKPDCGNPVIHLMEEQKRSARRVAPCVWAPTPARSPRGPWPRRPTARPRFPSAIATATSSTTPIATC